MLVQGDYINVEMDAFSNMHISLYVQDEDDMHSYRHIGSLGNSRRILSPGISDTQECTFSDLCPDVSLKFDVDYSELYMVLTPNTTGSSATITIYSSDDLSDEINVIIFAIMVISF